MKKQEILDEDWDNLIILDACRYDYFKKVYKKFLEGKLEKRWSRGSSTASWCCKTFTDYLDVFYFSSNPFINSRNIRLKELVSKGEEKWWIKKRIKGFDFNWNPTNHFKKVLDIWHNCWDKETNTVLPEDVNKIVLKSRHKNKRKIIHYLQPHQPYLSIKRSNLNKKPKKSRSNKAKKITKKTRFYLGPLIKSVNRKKQWKIKKYFGIGSLNMMQNLVVNNKIDTLKTLYSENLKIVLRNVSSLVNNLDGKTIVTADHGEAFGENGEWAHEYGSVSPVLRTVPWLKVNNIKK